MRCAPKSEEWGAGKIFLLQCLFAPLASCHAGKSPPSLSLSQVGFNNNLIVSLTGYAFLLVVSFLSLSLFASRNYPRSPSSVRSTKTSSLRETSRSKISKTPVRVEPQPSRFVSLFLSREDPVCMKTHFRAPLFSVPSN